MRILDKDNREINESAVDNEKGYLVQETIIVAHHEATGEVQEEYHYETVAEYPNGGKDVKRVIDVPYQPGREAYDEKENILRYTLYTAEELADIGKKKAEEEDKNRKLESLYQADMTFSDVVDAVAGIMFGGEN